jgi:exodeoxyribonuclease-3
VRVATWNINGLRARLDFLLHWLDARRPDLVGLQELKTEDDLFPHDELGAAGYHAVSHGQRGWNGVAILSRDPVVVTQVGLPGQEELGARLLTAAAGDLSFTTVYCPNGKEIGHQDFPRKLRWLEALREHFEGRHGPQRPTILCGDFNICPRPIDSWKDDGTDRSIFHSPEERRLLESLLAWGLRDVFRERHPDEQAYSWWDYRAGAFHRGLGMRLDLILASDPVMARVESITIDREYRKKKDGLTASDHAPVILDLA